MKQWVVYLLFCRDGSLYTGISSNLSRRLVQHNKGTASKYTRSRRPVVLVSAFKVSSRSEASKFERKIKKLSQSQKLDFFKNEITRRPL